MNKDNINKTIELIKFNDSLAFYMGDYITAYDEYVTEKNECGTACCLAGYATVSKYGGVDKFGNGDPFDVGKEYFGIDENTAEQLFIPRSGHISNTNKQDAIRVLEALRDTGKVIWDEIPVKD